jgi:DNA-binding IclR family transcriptional regulator
MGRDGGILGRYAAVLETLAAAPGGLTLIEVVQATGLPRGTVHRLLGALREIGYIEPRDGRKVYVLGPRLLRLLHQGAAPATLSALAQPILAELVARFEETAFVAKLVGTEVQSAAMAVPEGNGQSHVQPGRVMPLHAAASAKAIFAFQDEALIGEALGRPLVRYTDSTRVSAVEVRSELVQVRHRGFAVCDEELDPGVLSYACPVHLEGAGVIYSIGLVGLSQRLGRHSEAEIVATLRDAAASLSNGLPGGPSKPLAASVPARLAEAVS